MALRLRERATQLGMKVVGKVFEDPKRAEAIAGAIGGIQKAKEAFELALREALALGDNHIGTEHLLLALLRLEDDVAAKILRALGVEPEAIRTKLAA